MHEKKLALPYLARAEQQALKVGIFITKKLQIPSRDTCLGQLDRSFFPKSKNFHSLLRLNHKRYDNETNSIWPYFYSSFAGIYFRFLEILEIFLIND